jgi:putative redox protein
MTSPVAVTWIADMTFDAQLGDHHMMIDQSPPSGHGRGPSPVLLTLASVAACSAADVVSILRKSRQQLEGLRVEVHADRAQDHPRRFERVTLVFKVKGRRLDPAAVKRAVDLSDQKYCSITATLREHTDVASRFEIEDTGDDEGGPS